MLTAWELRQLLGAQPVGRMRWFGELLGWKGLRMEHVRCDRHDPPGPVAIYYVTTDAKFNLQINTQPHGQTRFHRAVVKPDRYGMHATAWFDFELFDDDELLRGEAERLRPFLSRQNFKSRAWRRANGKLLLQQYFDQQGLEWLPTTRVLFTKGRRRRRNVSAR